MFPIILFTGVASHIWHNHHCFLDPIFSVPVFCSFLFIFCFQSAFPPGVASDSHHCFLDPIFIFCFQVSPATAGTTSGVFGLGSKFRFDQFLSLGGKVSRLVLVILISTQTQWLNQCEQTASKEVTDSSKIWPKLHRLLRNQKIDAVFHRNCCEPVSHERHQLSFYHVKTFKKHFITRKLSPRAGSRHHCALVCKPLSRAGTGRGAGAVTGRREAKGRISPGDTDQPAKLV